ncbi:MAG: urease accessory protein UreD, partial [Pseudomonadota bacterium]
MRWTKMLFSANSPSDDRSPNVSPPTGAPISEPLRRVRADGRIAVTASVRDGVSRVTRCEERGGYRVRFPRRGDIPSGIMINTGGGLCSGDRLAIEATANDGASLEITTQAAERIYRSGDGARTDVTTTLQAGDGSALRWLPQETILFDRCRLRRRFDVDLAASATFLAVETLVFGRAAMGETLRDAHYQDQWRVRRGGALLYADAVRLAGDVAAELARPAVASGARVLSLIVYSAPAASERADQVRRALSIDDADAQGHAGVTGWGELLLVRALAPSVETMRQLTAKAITE